MDKKQFFFRKLFINNKFYLDIGLKLSFQSVESLSFQKFFFIITKENKLFFRNNHLPNRFQLLNPLHQFQRTFQCVDKVKNYKLRRRKSLSKIVIAMMFIIIFGKRHTNNFPINKTKRFARVGQTMSISRVLING